MSAIGVDIDDVIFPWYDRAHAASVRAGIDNGITPTTWHPYREYGVTVELWIEAVNAAIAAGVLYAGEPESGAVDALNALRSAGHTIHLITARGVTGLGHPGRVKADTALWLEEHAVPHDTLTFSKDKTVITTSFFIDDNADNIAAVCATGSRGFLVDQPWNTHAEHDDRVQHIREFATHILEAA